MNKAKKIEPFIVKHYSSDEAPCIKGNGFDGITVGETRGDTQEFIDWVNARLREREELFQLLSDSFWMLESHEARGEEEDEIISRARALRKQLKGE